LYGKTGERQQVQLTCKVASHTAGCSVDGLSLRRAVSH
jgi:hypothetical protein